MAVKAAADFEKTIDAAGAVLGKTAAQMEPVRKLALQIGQDTKFGAQEVAAGIEELAKAGLTIEQITGGAARGVASLAAAAGDMKLEDAATIAVNAMKTFGLEANQLDHVADSLAGAANASTLEVEDLAVSMRYAGGTAKAMGVSIDEMNTVLAILGDRGIRGSTAGTSLRGVLLSLAPTSKKAAAMMKELGLITEDGTNQFFNAKGEMKSMKEVMQILGDATKNLSEQQRVQAFNVIFQRRAMASALFMAEAGAKGFDQYADAIGRVSATEVAEAKLDNLAGDIEKLKSNIETLLITAGTPFQEQLREWTQSLTKLVQAFADLPEEQQKTIMKTLAYAAAFFTAFGAMSIFIGQVLKWIALAKQIAGAMKWISSFVSFTQILGKLKFALFAVRYAIQGSLIPAIQSLWAVMLANPIGLVIAAIVAIGAGLFILYKKWEPFRKLVDQTWQDFQVGWDLILNFARDLREKLGGAVSAVASFFVGVGRAIAGFISFMASIPGQVVAFISRIPELVVEFLGKAVHEISQMPERVAGALAFLLGFILQSIAKSFMTFVELGHSAIESIVGFFQKLPGRVITFLDELWDGGWDRFFRFRAMALEFIKDLVEGVIEWFRLLPGRVITFVNQLWDETYANFMRGKDLAIEVVKQWFNNTLQFFKDLPGNVIAAVNSLWDLLWQTMHGIGYRAYDGIKAGFDALLSFIKGLPRQIIDALSNLRTELFNKLKSIGESAWEGFKKGLFGSPKTKIEYALMDLLAYTKGFNYDMGSEMAKLHSMTFDKFGPSVVPAMAMAGAGAGVGAAGGGVTNNNYNDDIKVTGADQKTSMEISKDIMYQKRVRLYT